MNFCNITELEIVIRAFSLDNVHSLDQKDVQYFGHWLCLLQLQVKGRCTAKDYSGIQARSQVNIKNHHVVRIKWLDASLSSLLPPYVFSHNFHSLIQFDGENRVFNVVV
jgi:hypothetical protein